MKRTHEILGIALAALGVCASDAAAQNIQFPRGAAPPPTISVPAPGGPLAPAVPGSTAINPYTGGVPFDPYSSTGSSAYNFWSSAPPSNAAGVFSQPPVSPYGATSPIAPAPAGSFPTYGPPPASPYATPPGTPQYLFPNGVNGPQFDFNQSLRFIQDVRFRDTYVRGGEEPTDLGINDAEIAVTFTIPNFLTTGQPLFISPAFALHSWDGPKGLPADLPATAYSAYLDMQFTTDPNLQIGAELGVRAGVYSDFETLNSDSVRYQGLALGVFRLTPTLSAKLGVIYLDRNRVKLLPAGGVLWTPTPQVRFDIFFPQPKLSAYLTTVGRYEVWGYVAGEYGGGAWTIQRADLTDDNIDINDFRLSTGLEWTGPRGLTGFMESGFVFKREVLFAADPTDDFNPQDAFMIRAGFSF